MIRLLLASTLMVSYGQCGITTKDKIIPGEYIIRMKEGYSRATVGSILQGAKVISTIREGVRPVYLVRAGEGVAAGLVRHPGVDLLENNRKVRLDELETRPVLADPGVGTVPTGDVECREQKNTNHSTFNIWGLIRTSHRNLPNYTTDRYRWRHDGEGVDIYVLDSGIDICHPDFEGRAMYGMYASNLDEGYVDLNGHGTHVASTAGGRRWGVAKKARLVSCKVLGRFGVGSSAGIYEGIQYVIDRVIAQRAQGYKPRAVINLSLGTFGFSQTMYDLLQEAWDLGIVNVAAAGNNAGPASGVFPAAHDNVITVGSTRNDDQFSGFSNHGCEVAVSAPGSDVTAAWSTQTLLCRNNRPIPEECVTSISGTSMASPHVAGMVARHLSSMTDSEYKATTPNIIQDILTATAVKDKIIFGRLPPNAEDNTTNRILYKECGTTDWSPDNVYTPCPFVHPEPEEVVFMVPAMPDREAVQGKNTDVIDEEYLVRVKDEEVGAIETMLKVEGVRMLRRIKVAGRTVALVTASKQAIKRIKSRSWVDHVEHNRKYKLIEPVDMKLVTNVGQPEVREGQGRVECKKQENTNNTEFNIWGLIRTSYRDLPDFNTDPYLWYHEGEGVDIYILDTGVDSCHPEFESRLTHGMYAADLLEGHADLNGHGTHVASKSAGKVWGVAKKANIISVKVLGRNAIGQTDNILEGIQWVSDRVRKQKEEGKPPRAVMSLALGSLSFSRLMYDALQEGWDLGVINVAAAGNNAGNASGFFPAAFDNVITVGATTSEDRFALFSNYGCELAVSAPGSDITAAWSTETRLCRNVRPFPVDCIASLSGSSMGVGHVIGVVARYLSSLTDEELQNVTASSVQDMVTATAVTDRINFSLPFQELAERYTTNRLLHKECRSSSWNPEDSYQPCPFVPPEDPEEPEDPDPIVGGAMVPMHLIACIFLCIMLVI